VTALTTGAAVTAATGATAGLAFLADFSATTGAAATGAAAAGATSVFLDTRLAAAGVADLFIVLLPVVFWDIFKRAMTYIVFIPTVKFCG
jgi:hypothetical protein